MTTLFLSTVLMLVGYATSSETLPSAPSFTWDFSSNNDTETLLSCGTYSLIATENASLDGGQQYSIRAFTPDVTPIYTNVGSDASSLQWQVPFPTDSQIMLGMVDAHNQSAEVKGPYGINGSVQDAQCFPSKVSSPPSFHVTTNVTAPTSCEAVGIFIFGGTPPYNVTIVIEGVGIITRAMDGKDDLYTWFNIAPAGRRIIFSALDRDGKLAGSSQIIASEGDLDSCPISSFSSTSPKKESKAKTVAGWSVFAAGMVFFILLVLYGELDWEPAIRRRLARWRRTVRGRILQCRLAWESAFGTSGVQVDEEDEVPDTRPHTPDIESGHPNRPATIDSTPVHETQVEVPFQQPTPSETGLSSAIVGLEGPNVEVQDEDSVRDEEDQPQDERANSEKDEARDQMGKSDGV